MMVDVIRTRIHDIYAGFDNRAYNRFNNNVTDNARPPPVVELNLAGRVHKSTAAAQRRRAIQKDVTQTVR